MHRSAFAFCVKAFPAPTLVLVAIGLSFAAQNAGGVTVAGKTPGTFALSSTGAATYRIPIWSPQGVGDVQLDLALVYNSRTPNGLLGMGWSLSGLSSITRCNKTWAQDGGAPERVTLTVSDRFCLDGKQLKLVSGSYGQAGSVYATEIESFSKIIASGTSGNGPASFTVKTKNGLIYDYGITADSKIKPGGGTTIQTWALSRIRDRVVANNGNKITLSYTNDTANNTYRIASIAYPTTASGQGPFYEVLFSYGTRSAVDTPSGYSAGYAWREPNRLTKITIRNYGVATPTKTYTLTYGQGNATGRSRLTSVEECSGLSNCLAKTNISYQSGTQGWAGSTTTSITNISTAVGVNPVPVDLSSDGLTDLFYPKVQTSSSSRWYAAIATASGFGAPKDTGIVTPNSTHEFVGSFDGSGQQQLMMQLGGYWNVVKYNGTSFTATSSGVPVNGEYASVDYDGDGLSDLASVVGNEIRVRRNITVPAGPVTFAATATTVFTYTGTWSIAGGPTSRMAQMDFDGNGRGDLYFTTSLNTGFGNIIRGEVLRSNGFGASASHTQLLSPGTSPRAGDWNSDGCSDIIGGGHVYLSNCAGAFTTISSGGCNSAAACMVGDWDGDGRTDVLYVNTANNFWYVKRSTGEGFVAAAATGISAPLGTQWFVFDKDGDGLMDAGYIDTTANNVVRFRLHQGATVPADLATSFTDGYGINYSPTYVTISRSNYTKYADAVFPEQDFKGPLYVVGQLTASDGTGGTYNQTLHYWGARFHAQGRGLEGFYARRIIDSRNGLYDYAYFARTFPHTGMMTSQDLKQSSGPSISKWTSVLGSQNLGPAGVQRRYFPFLSSITQSEYELDGTLDGDLVAQRTVAYTYGDTFGNPTLVVTSTTDKDPGSPFYNNIWQTTVDTTYQNDSASNCLGLPDRSEITNVVPGQTTETRTFEYANDTTLCRTYQEVIEPNIPALKVTTTLAFDPNCANVQTVTVVGSNPNGTAMPARTTTLNFGTRCQLPISLTNALNETTTFDYLYDFGVLSALTDPNGFLTSYEFDDFGRRTREDRPDGTATVWTYARCATPPCWGAADLRLRVTEDYRRTTDASFNTRQLHYDGMERLRTDETNRVLGVWTINAMTYDALGRVATKYHPYTSGTTADNYFKWNYDSIGRVKDIKLYRSGSILDRTTTLTYAGRTTTIEDNLGRETSYIHDVAGRLRHVIDPAPGGTTKYDYDAFGNLKKITDPILAVSQGTYNLRGFRTQWQDADRGTWNFTANSLNELVSWTNAKTQSFSMEYDLLGRMKKRYDNGQLSEFIWGDSAAAGNLGRLKSKSGGGYLEELFYDGVGRLSNRRITTDQVYNYNFTYNNIGALDYITYPVSPKPAGETATRFKIRYLYSYGHPYRIQDVTHSAFTIWDLTNTNPFSSPTAETLGPSLISVRSTYKSWTNELTSMTAGVSGSTTNRQNLSYAWSSVGNLTQRQDLIQGLTEAFTYDALDRIDTSTLNGVPNLNVDYDSAGSGNIQSKSDVGTYAYNAPNKPHAVTAAGALTFAYDNNGNVTTRNGLAQTWTSFDLPATLQADVGGTVYSSQFSYGPDHQRWKQVATYWNGTETTHYVGGLLEKASTSGVTLWRHYVPTPSGLTIIVSRNSDNTKSTSYVLSDHLGSSDAILDEFGAVITRLSFDAFGARRGSNWLAATPPDWPGIAETTRRGFTFHEMLDNINLIHMNGRTYDPVVGRFMSVDPLIGDMADGQSVNPFSYVANRPLNHIDPTGLDGGLSLCAGNPQICIGVVESILGAIFGGLFGSDEPPPPPASTWPGTSAQNGINVCDPGMSSPSCGGSPITGFGPMTGRILEASPDAPKGTCAECHHGDIGDLLAGLLRGAWDLTVYGAVYYVKSGGLSGQLAIEFFGDPTISNAIAADAQRASQWIIIGRPDTNLGELGYDLGPAVPAAITLGRTYFVVRAATARAPLVVGKPVRGVLQNGARPGGLTTSEAQRIQNAANRIGKPINVVGSRARGPVDSSADYDYVIDANARVRNSVSRSLPGAGNIREGIRPNIDVFKGTVDPNRPSIRFDPESP